GWWSDGALYAGNVPAQQRPHDGWSSGRMWRGWGLALVAACASSNAPRVKAPPPAPPPPSNAACPTCCDESVQVVEVDPASTLGFIPYGCWLRLEGRYAMEQALAEPPPAIFDLLCREGADESLQILYQGAPVGDDPITDLADPYHTDRRENVNTVSYSVGAPTNARFRFEAGEIRFQRIPRARLDVNDAGAQRDARGGYVELGLDLRFEGDRRFRAALRICPTYADYGPVSDPIE
ncbi:MAG: hypothetical protein AB7L28_09655, partial [Kofleriaceae bacterium]